MTPRHRALTILLVASAIVAGARAASGRAARPQSSAPPSGPVLLAPSGPKVRIGLTTDPVKVRVSADGGIVVRDPVRKQPIWKKKFDGGIYLVSEVSGGGEPGVIYRVQVASFVAKEQAETKKAEMEALLPGEKVILVYNPDRRAWRGPGGEVLAPQGRSPLGRPLQEEGVDGRWV